MVHPFPSGATVDRTFGALSDPTRRGILEELGTRGEVSISWIADRFGISVTGAAKHVRVLEAAGIVRSTKQGRTRRCTLSGRPLDDSWAWLENYRQILAGRLDRLAQVPQPEPQGER